MVVGRGGVNHVWRTESTLLQRQSLSSSTPSDRRVAFPYSTRKCLHAAMPLTFRMKSVLGNSRGAVGDLSRRKPAPSGRRSALRLFTSLLARTQSPTRSCRTKIYRFRVLLDHGRTKRLHVEVWKMVS